jgi:two-component system CheB/CheR fusion protein
MSMPEQTGPKSRLSPAFVVGIGASAGGLESLEKLFQNLPADTGMAFVIIQHLSPDFKCMMYELLARDTKMQIHRVEDEMQIETDQVYLLPAKKEIIIAGGE